MEQKGTLTVFFKLEFLFGMEIFSWKKNNMC